MSLESNGSADAYAVGYLGGNGPGTETRQKRRRRSADGTNPLRHVEKRLEGNDRAVTQIINAEDGIDDRLGGRAEAGRRASCARSGY